jgi:hypothetical protein
MSITAADIRAYLEGYGITDTQLSSNWIENRLNNFVIPFVENYTRQNFDGVQSITEYYSGTGNNVLMLNRRPIVSITEIRYVIGGYSMPILNLSMIETIAAEGIIKAKSNFDEAYFLPVFAKGSKNIKVVYTYGWSDYPVDIKEAIIMLTSTKCLTFVGARTGGGALGVQGFSRNYGARGKYTDEIQQIDREAIAILNKYKSSVVGS